MILTADVILSIAVSSISNKPYTYRVPFHLEEKVKVGVPVRVPFGRLEKTGYVISLGNYQPKEELKDILNVVDDVPIFSEEILALCRWVSSYYLCSFGDALRCVLPSSLRKAKTLPIKYRKMVGLARRAESKLPEIIESLSKKAPKHLAVLNFFQENKKDIALQELLKKLVVSSSVIKTLEKKGLLVSYNAEVWRTPLDFLACREEQNFTLTNCQQSAVEEINTQLDQGEHKVYLLYGVTGSGKTEVYCQAIAHNLKKGKQAIVLVPEISLTPQMVRYFKERFPDQVALLHSGLSDGERYDEWRKARLGLAPIVIGTRSAIFAPLSNLGLIIIDEEQEYSYKQENYPRYHAKEVAIKRGELSGSVVVLGTATPSLETYYHSQNRNYQLISLPVRVENRPLPCVEIIDMREELEAGHRSVLSRQLIKEISCTLAKGEQVILFLNRRGFSTFILCRTCGYVAKCPRCDVSLTYHMPEKNLSCHYCNYQETAPVVCPKCRSYKIRYFGAGTQKIEEQFRAYFPKTKVLRMDKDTTGQKYAREKMLAAFEKGEAQVLIGTQMIAKGLDFPYVSLVGVISADVSLNLPDFRAGERTFHLLMQISGRSGRGEITGKVIIQTYSPEHYSIEKISSKQEQEFYRQELQYREELGYPPYNNLVNVIFTGELTDQVEKTAESITEQINQLIDREKISAAVLGPVPAPVSKIKEKYRWHLLIKTNEIEKLTASLKKEDFILPRKLHVTFDVDPIDLI